MELTTPTAPQLAEFTGIQESDLNDYHPQALQQAIDLLSIRTSAAPVTGGVSVAEGDTDTGLLQRVFVYGISAMAEKLIEERPDRGGDAASPFSAERIGSWSYTRKNADGQFEQTGVSWYDKLEDLINASEGSGSVAETTNINVINDTSLEYLDTEGQRHVAGPADVFTSPTYGG